MNAGMDDVKPEFADVEDVPEGSSFIPAPYPIQRNITKTMRASATDIDRMQAWAGQSAGLTRAEPAAELISDLWSTAKGLLQS